jgi:hypothetical protein
MIGNGNVLKPGLPLVGIPGMFLKHYFHLLDTLGALLQKDLIGDGSREHMAGMFQAEAGRGNTASVRSTRDAISNTAASYVISDEQGARQNVLDNLQ